MNNVSYDELNILSFEDYFDVMEISKGQKKSRVLLAGAFLDAFLFIFAYAKRLKGKPQAKQEISAMVKDEVIKIIPSKFKTNGKVTDKFISYYVEILVASLAKTITDSLMFDDSYYLSYDRAFRLAASEANTVENYSDYADALSSGKTQKTWLTEQDERVRPTHAIVDGKTIGISEFFRVGSANMRFPHDILYASDHPEELINCRCSIAYK